MVNTGTNVFDFSGGGGKPVPNGPPLPSFAGGPCIGSSASLGGSGPGFSIGGGIAREDESCQRRTWVQTLIGASQHMTPEEAYQMRRLAFEIMREDEYLAGAFQRMGYPSLEPNRNNRVSQTNLVQGAPAASGPRLTTSTKNRVAVASPTCWAVISASSPAVLKDALKARGCALEEK